MICRWCARDHYRRGSQIEESSEARCLRCGEAWSRPSRTTATLRPIITAHVVALFVRRDSSVLKQGLRETAGNQFHDYDLQDYSDPRSVPKFSSTTTLIPVWPFYMEDGRTLRIACEDRSEAFRLARRGESNIVVQPGRSPQRMDLTHAERVAVPVMKIWEAYRAEASSYLVIDHKATLGYLDRGLTVEEIAGYRGGFDLLRIEDDLIDQVTSLSAEHQARVSAWYDEVLRDFRPMTSQARDQLISWSQGRPRQSDEE